MCMSKGSSAVACLATLPPPAIFFLAARRETQTVAIEQLVDDLLVGQKIIRVTEWKTL